MLKPSIQWGLGFTMCILYTCTMVEMSLCKNPTELLFILKKDTHNLLKCISSVSQSQQL